MGMDADGRMEVLNPLPIIFTWTNRTDGHPP